MFLRLQGVVLRLMSMNWVFGYGSLIFRHDFPWQRRCRASIEGWTRRFWQGSHDHRGLPHAPGRVVTLISKPDEVCSGMAYLVDEETMAALDYREKNGYCRLQWPLRFEDGTTETGIVYVADPHNHAFLGPAPIDEIAEHIIGSSGPSGPNLDYLLDLAAALRELNVDDEHVFALARLAGSGEGPDLVTPRSHLKSRERR